MNFRRRRFTAAPPPREPHSFLWPKSTLEDYEVKEIGSHRFVRLIRREATAKDDAAEASTGYEFRRIVPRSLQPGGYELKALSEHEIAELMLQVSDADGADPEQVAHPQAGGTEDNDVPSAETIYLDEQDIAELTALDLRDIFLRGR